MRSSALTRAAGALAVGAAVGVALYPLLSAEADEASCSVTPSSYADAILNPPKGEDTDFFVNTGGIPSIMFLLDTSRSMLRLPPDGASNGWGSFEGNPSRFGCTNAVANTTVFHSACGLTTGEGLPYNPPADGLDAPPEWAEAKDESGQYCPYMVSGNQAPKRDKPGYDPDFYPALFAADRVYHDTLASGTSAAVDGWSDSSGNPTADASVSAFCGRLGWTAEQRASCGACMNDRGYWFDGSYLAWMGPSCANSAECQARGLGTCIKDATGLEYNTNNNDNTSHCRIPNVWFSGNYLNFYPPKFVIARKVMKDVLSVVRKMRLGLTTLNGDDGGLLQEKLTPPCQLMGSPNAFDANRSSIKNALNNTSQVSFTNDYAPLAEALLDIGQLYATKTDPWFTSTFANTSFEDAGNGNQKSVCFPCQATAVLMISDGQPTADGIIPGPGFAPSAMTRAVANTSGSYAGMAGYNITGIGDTDCPVCNTAAEAADTTIPAGECFGQQASGACAGANNPIQSYLPKVAWYLRNMDFRNDGETASDGFKMTRKQNVTTYTIGLGTRGNTSLVLEHTATAGGGFYNGGSGSDVTDAKTLRDAILRVLEDVNTRSTSFGAASLSTLQASASQGVLVPRFEPSRAAHWNGHLYAFDLYSEFTGDSPPCHIPTTGASGPANGDYDCDGRCTSVFLKDADGDFIQEDGTGAFKKNNPKNRAACGYGNRCTSCGTASNSDAKPRWDAGDKLSPLTITTDPATGAQTTTVKASGYKGWDERAVYTVTDSNGDGKFTAADTVIQVTPSSVADTLAPYLNIQGTSYCSNLAARLTAVGNPAGATIESQFSSGEYTKCAEVILQYVLGADVFNERRCSGFPNTLCTRAYQLGDVFHSSPTEVWPPLPSDGYLCARGLHPQCLASLFSNSLPPDTTAGTNAKAYDSYAKYLPYKHRKKFALVGANDGMLHAFVTAKWRLADDPRTTPKEDVSPFDGFHDDRPSTVPQVGEELWAFIPPDLLPKLRLLLESTHHFFVDGTAMVRDVWMDGGHANRSGDGSTKADGKRQGTEFHTIAILGERRGGTHYFALDVTDATDDLDGKPRFLWLYPQPNDPEELAFGETYVEFVPKPPPIGPVRIDAGTSCAADAPRFSTASGDSRCFEERWIAFLSGGFDVQYTKGRGVHMVDVASGDELWDFSQPPGAASTCTADSDPRCHLNYPVAASVGMMMWGKQANFLSAAALDGYFDTATFGDTGGQLWVLRFSDPGVIDGTTKKVSNWYGARVFQHAKASAADCGLNYCAGQPFFYITSNLPLQANGLYRVLAGTGDRFNLLDPVGGVCGPDNLRACIMKGCTVSLEDASGGPGAVYGVSSLLGTQSYGMDHAASCTTVDASGYTFDRADPSGTSCTTVTSKIDGLVITCPSDKTCSGLAETTKKKMALSCNAAGSCEPATTNELGSFIDLKGNLDRKNWFFSVQVFEREGDRAIFHDVAGAKAFDAARLSETDLVDINAHDADATKPLATADSKGWRYYFDHGAPSTPTTATVGGTIYDIFRTDERTASVSAVEASCTFWNTMQTGVPQDSYDGTTGCPVNSPCKAARSQLSYLYGASPSTGGLCLHIDGTPTRFQKNETLVPPHIGKLVAYVSSGQVSFGLTSVRIPQGGSNIALGEVQDIQSVVEWLPVDHATHDCRHSPKDQNAPPCK